MSGDRDDASGSESASPWASDDIPPSQGLGAITWETQPAGPDETPRSSASRRSAVAGGTTATTDSIDTNAGQRRRPHGWMLAALVAVPVVLAAAAVVVVVAGNDDASPTAEDEPDPASTDPLEAVVEPTTTAADVTVPRAEVTVPVIDRLAQTPPDGPIRSIELPAEVAAISVETLLFAVRPDGIIYIISIPSGDVTTIDLGPAPERTAGVSGSTSIVAAPDAIMVITGDGQVAIVPRSGEPRVVDTSPLMSDDTERLQIFSSGWVLNGDGSTAFVLLGGDGFGLPTKYHVGIDGSLQEAGELVVASPGFSQFAHGQRLINDAGGIYRLHADGTDERISDGTLLAASEFTLLVRECDPSRECETVIESTTVASRRAAFVPYDLGIYTYGLSLSPNGDALVYTRFSESESRQFLDLATGTETAATGESVGGTTQGSWAGDSSGEFLSAGARGLQFTNRFTGETVDFGAELGIIAALTTRIAS